MQPAAAFSSGSYRAQSLPAEAIVSRPLALPPLGRPAASEQGAGHDPGDDAPPSPRPTPEIAIGPGPIAWLLS